MEIERCWAKLSVPLLEQWFTQLSVHRTFVPSPGPLFHQIPWKFYRFMRTFISQGSPVELSSFAAMP